MVLMNTINSHNFIIIYSNEVLLTMNLWSTGFLRKVEVCSLFRSILLEVFYKKGILRNFAKFTGKHLCHLFLQNTSDGCFLIFHLSQTLRKQKPLWLTLFWKKLEAAALLNAILKKVGSCCFTKQKLYRICLMSRFSKILIPAYRNSFKFPL